MMAQGLKTLVLLAALASGAARADRLDDDLEPDCSGHHPCPPHIRMYLKTANMQTVNIYEPSLTLTYGEDIVGICTACNVGNLIVTKSDSKSLKTSLKTQVNNSKRIQWNISRPDVGYYNYICEDTICGLYDAVGLRVLPRVSVVAGGVHRKLVRQVPQYKEWEYFVPFGETYQIFCTANDATSLDFKRSFSKWTAFVLVNDTTLKYEGRADEVTAYSYTCKTNRRTTFIHIVVDYPPEAQEFECVSYLNYDKMACKWCLLHKNNINNQYYESRCTWRSKSKKTTFDLFSTDVSSDEESDSVLLCSERSSETYRECKWENIWNTFFSYNSRFRIDLVACNDFYCHNQTFQMERSSIMKLESVANLNVIASSHGADVTWSFAQRRYPFKDDKHVYKVEYRLLEKRWRRADTSSVRCENDRCVLQLNLECPELYYELRVHVKLAAAENRLWSEPVSKSFFTAPAADESPLLACRAALEEPEPVTPEAALSELHKLIKHTLDRNSALRRQVRGLRPKLDVVESLTASLAESTDVGARVPTR